MYIWWKIVISASMEEIVFFVRIWHAQKWLHNHLNTLFKLLTRRQAFEQLRIDMFAVKENFQPPRSKNPFEGYYLTLFLNFISCALSSRRLTSASLFERERKRERFFSFHGSRVSISQEPRRSWSHVSPRGLRAEAGQRSLLSSLLSLFLPLARIFFLAFTSVIAMFLGIIIPSVLS